MKILNKITAALIFTTLQTFAQAPAIEWEHSYGGFGEEVANDVLQTSDGGYIFVSSCNSTSGDVVGNPYTYSSLFVTSYWVVKTDAAGAIQWQTTLGGFYDDRPMKIRETNDGGYIIGGHSESSDGNVTGHIGNYDYWIVKISVTGTLEWQKVFGTTSDDRLTDIIQTSDGGYLTVGYTPSTTLAGSHGLTDVFVVKMSATGTFEWRKPYGGPYHDYGYGVLEVSGGYLLAGKVRSISGDVTGNHGLNDAWVVKIDTVGAIIWQKAFGGTADDSGTSLAATHDGNFVLLGDTASNDGDVTGNHGGLDLWLIKFDPEGNLIWQKPYGGTDSQIAGNGTVSMTSDNGFVMCGGSFGSGGIPGHHGGEDAYIVKTDADGTMQWQRPVGGGNYDEAAAIVQTADNGYMMAGHNSEYLNNNGDWEINHGSYDAWLVKLVPEALSTAENIGGQKTFFIYPNPAKNMLHIMSLDNITLTKVTITDMLGKTVFERIGDIRDIAVDRLAPGVYSLQAAAGNMLYSEKFVKN